MASLDLWTLLETWQASRDPALVPLIVLLGEKVSIDETKRLDGLKSTALGKACLLYTSRCRRPVAWA